MIGNKRILPLVPGELIVEDKLTDKFFWDEKLSVGDAEIDSQHKNLIAMVNRLSDEQDSNEIKQMVLEMFKYTRAHFKKEEDLFIKISFPTYKRHTEIHNNLITKLGEINQESLETREGKENFKQFLYDWLINHIMNEDMEYKKYLT